MGKNANRLVVSFTLSALFALGTHYWFRQTERNFVGRDVALETPVAEVQVAGPGVERKPTKRLIWQSIKPSDSLYAGEELRTPDLGSAEIEFLDSQTKVEVEPGSLITIENSAEGPQIDLISGNLFIDDSASTHATTVQLKSEGKLISREKGKVAISKSKEGKLELTPETALTVAAPGVLGVLRPKLRDQYYLDRSKAKNIELSLQEPLAESQSLIVRLGLRRDRLKPLAVTRLDSKTFLVPVVSGDFFWQAQVIQDSDKKVLAESRVGRLKLVATEPPVLLWPRPKASVVLLKESMKTRFEWANPAGLQKLTLEIASSSDLKVDRQAFLAGDRLATLLPLKVGTYYWRVLGYLPDQSYLSTPVQVFEVTTPPLAEAIHSRSSQEQPQVQSSSNPEPLGEPPAEALTETKSENLAGPSEETQTPSEKLTPDAPQFSPQSLQSLQATRSGKFLVQWEPVDLAEHYEVELKDSRGQAKILQTRTPRLELEKLSPGKAEVTIWAVTKEGSRSPASVPISIAVPSISDARAPKLKTIQFQDDGE